MQETQKVAQVTQKDSRKYISEEDIPNYLNTMGAILGLSQTERDVLEIAKVMCENYLELKKSISKKRDITYCPHIHECKTFGYGCDGVSYEFCEAPKDKVDDTEGLVLRKNDTNTEED